MDKLFETDGFYKKLLDDMRIGVIVSDARGNIIYLNETYARFLNIRIQDSIGKHATEVISNTRLHIVAETGQAEINYPHKFNDIGLLVQRIPIKEAGRVVAVLGLVLFDSASTVARLAEKLVYLESKLKAVQSELASIHATRYSLDDIIGDSRAIKLLKKQAIKAANSVLPVLITGESGTGKELFAQSIHRESARRAYPFVRINCAAIPRELFESELFGYDKGAFSGADRKGRAGKFELAHMGSIFLDEVGDMPMEMQPKLLRVLELKEFERIGSNRLISSDFRVIAATNRDLEQLMQAGRFRRDLFFRLNGIPLNIQPLRTRRRDIRCLADFFLKKIVDQYRDESINISANAYHLLEQYSWPGNGRELLHVLERAAFSTSGNKIKPADLPDYLHSPLPPPPVIKNRPALKTYMRAAEKYAIEHALAEANQNRSLAAETLSIHRTLLYRKMRLLGMLNPPKPRPDSIG